ncbi:hypothetical protein ANCDUO_10218 [Ancylostoma duodenale]|uniref:Uncharacterized protein n=1 Tax=Ancylostoma duodenale TaxID=51022 RepID=A0A0C2DAY0_9BILA|nr:hypothetical protein ANCDUO_10218 [Ancylostoma duodenale]
MREGRMEGLLAPARYIRSSTGVKASSYSPGEFGTTGSAVGDVFVDQPKCRVVPACNANKT